MTFIKKQLADSELGLVSGGTYDNSYEADMNYDVNVEYNNAAFDDIFSALADK